MNGELSNNKLVKAPRDPPFQSKRTVTRATQQNHKIRSGRGGCKRLQGAARDCKGLLGATGNGSGNTVSVGERTVLIKFLGGLFSHDTVTKLVLGNAVSKCAVAVSTSVFSKGTRASGKR